MPSSSSSLLIISKCTVYPETKSTLKSLKLSISDLPMLSCQYIQKGVLLSQPPFETTFLLSLLKQSLSKTLSHFPPLAGRFHTDEEGYIYVLCNDAGVDFYHAQAPHLSVVSLLATPHLDLPQSFREFFQFDGTLNYAGHHKPLVAVQITELNDGVFIGCTVNHSIVDGTSFWNFFNTFAELCRGNTISKPPVFTRETVFNSPAVLKLPKGGPAATFSGNDPLREKIFRFSREAIFKLKCRANNKECHIKVSNGVFKKDSTAVISSFQSLSAQLWRSVARAKKFAADKKTTFRMAVNCRSRLDPRLAALYFGNAIQSITTVASVGDLLSEDLNWAADLLHQNVVAHDDGTVRRGIKDWESSPRLFPLGNFDGAMITMGSSPRFPMYDNDFGWGRPLAVRSGKANKFDGNISAFPGREGNGSVDLEVVLAPETMAGLENDDEFMQYVP